MRPFSKLLPMFLLLVLVGTACGESQKVGSEKLLDFKEGEGGQRLGFETPPPDATPVANAIDVQRETPAPRVTPTPAPTAQIQYFDVELIADSPYYKAGGQPSNLIAMRASAVLRVTNKDATAERKCRSFTAANGAFNSGCMPFGEKPFTFKFPGAGRFAIKDEGLTFASATLEVQ